ncbi:MAG TPA: mandelate racemase/muconate lactonizing enzyme family protein [Candidatus Limnocylindrales bacterium]|nr:mandelate racemase/muconate lactonizing enzyme family protein [Candidatus Limnocylindrales bacterium]
MTTNGHAIERIEIFVIRHRLNPRTGPSIALSSEHAYALVKATDGDGRAGWGETYLVPGVASILEDTAPVLVGRRPADSIALKRDIRWSAEHAYAASALTIAVEDLAARQLGISIAQWLGGAVRSRVRLYAASGGYIDGVDPADSWPAEVERIRDSGFTAMKWRVGRHPIAHEAPLLERIRGDVPDDFAMMADGNAGYTLPRAIEMGGILERLGFIWFEEPMVQRPNYARYDELSRALSITLAAGEALETRGEAIDFLARRAADVIQPEPVICGGAGEALWISELAAAQSTMAIPHTSNSAIGIALALQVIACLPDPTRSPASEELFLEYGVDDNPHRSGLLQTPLEFRDGWVTVPTGPGLGVEIDEEYVRGHATETRVVGARAAAAG